jgi:transposase
MVMIGIDPHKGSHTAVAIDGGEVVVGERLVRATPRQVPELMAWADALGDRERIWAVESAGGLGYLLAQQLLAAGEIVVDIPATLASRVRLLGSGRSDKNDPNDARSVAIAALRAPSLVPVRVEDHATVLRLLSQRHRQLGWSYKRRRVGYMRWLLISYRAGSAKKSLSARPDRCSRATARSAPWPSSGINWLSTSSRSSTASPVNAPRCVPGSAPRSLPAGPASRRSSGSGR